MFVPDKNGKFDDVVLGHSTLDEYLDNEGERFWGATIERYANRIAKGKFELNGKKYKLATYNNGQCLNGSIKEKSGCKNKSYS